jgi:hypothetical protein
MTMVTINAAINRAQFNSNYYTDGNVPDEIAQIAARTYAEYSPSGAGVRAFSVGSFGNNKAPKTDDTYGFETFTSSGFVTFTGNVLPICELLGEDDTVANNPVVNAIIQKLCDTRFGAKRVDQIDDDFTVGHEPRLGLTVEGMLRILGHVSADIGRDEWIRVGMALHHECEGDDTGFDLWDTWSADGATYPGSENLRVQWDSFDRRVGRGHKQTTMASVIQMAKRNGYIHTRPDSATSPETMMARVEAITAELRTDRSRFATVPIHELAQRPPGKWLIKNVLPDDDLVILYGASGSGKTFVALDMAFHVAQGLPWRGNKSEQGTVVIIAAEGTGGLGKRADAYARYHNLDLSKIPLHVITAAPNFLEQEDIAEVLAELKTHENVKLVVIDTLAQVTPGANENGAEDMGRALANVRLIREVVGSTPMAVHHSGKDASKGSRGWSGLKAAASAQVEVLRHEGGQREIHLEKMKDGEDGVRFGFKLEIVELGLDADGDMLTSCVALEADLPVAKAEDRPSKGVVRYGANERHVLEVIESEYAAVESVSETLFVARCADLLPKPDAGKRDQRLFLMRRAVQSLVKRKDGPIAVEHGRVIFCT